MRDEVPALQSPDPERLLAVRVGPMIGQARRRPRWMLPQMMADSAFEEGYIQAVLDFVAAEKHPAFEKAYYEAKLSQHLAARQDRQNRRAT